MTTHDPKTELNTYKKYLTRRCLDSIRTEYTSLTTGAKPVKSAVDIAVSVPTGVYDIIANFLAWIPRKGDNCDILDITNVNYMKYGMMVYDKQETWRAAQVLEVTYPFTDTPAFLIHYKSWGSRYDDIISAVGLDRIQPAFSKTPNWRPKVKRGDNLEFLIPNRFDERYWRVGVVLKNKLGKLDLMTVENLESSVQVILYAKSSSDRLELLRKTGVNGLSISQDADLKEIRKALPKGFPIQGNLDPELLETNPIV